MASEANDNDGGGGGRPAAPSPFQRRTLWKALTGLSFAVIAILVVASIVVAGKVIGFLQPVLVPLAVAGILAYLLDPVVRWVGAKQFFGRDLNRLQAMGIVFFLAVAAIVVVGFAVFVPAARQLTELFDKKADIIAKAEAWMTGINRKLVSFESQFGIGKESEAEPPKGGEGTGDGEEPEAGEPDVDGDTVSPFAPPPPPAGDGSEPAEAPPAGGAPVAAAGGAGDEPESQLWGEFMKWLQSPETGRAALGFVGKAANGFFGALGYIVGFFLVPVYLFFFLKDSASIREGWANYVPLRNSWLKDEVVSVLSEVNGYLIAYFRGQVLVSIIDGVATGLILTLMGLDFAVVIGVSLAVLGIIPFVGFILTAVPAVLIAAAQSHEAANPVIYPLAVALVFVGVQQIDGIFVQPKIVGESVGLHPLTVIFSVLFWSLLIGGILGALLAVPLTAAAKVLFRRYIWEQRIRPNVLDEGPPPPAPEPSSA